MFWMSQKFRKMILTQYIPYVKKIRNILCFEFCKNTKVGIFPLLQGLNDNDNEGENKSRFLRIKHWVFICLYATFHNFMRKLKVLWIRVSKWTLNNEALKKWHWHWLPLTMWKFDFLYSYFIDVEQSVGQCDVKSKTLLYFFWWKWDFNLNFQIWFFLNYSEDFSFLFSLQFVDLHL